MALGKKEAKKKAGIKSPPRLDPTETAVRYIGQRDNPPAALAAAFSNDFCCQSERAAAVKQ